MFSTIALVDRIRQSGERTDLLAAFQLAMRELGFKWSNLSVAKNMNETDYEVLVSNWPDAIRVKFHEKAASDRDFAGKLPAEGRNFSWYAQQLEGYRHDSFISTLIEHGVMTGAFASLTDFNGRGYKLVVGAGPDMVIGEDLIGKAIILATVTLMRLDSIDPAAMAAPRATVANLNLSPIQHQILKWAAAGKSNADIAAILNLSTSAVSYQLARIYKILGVATKLQAVAMLTGPGPRSEV